jgi:hypothetical protein
LGVGRGDGEYTERGRHGDKESGRAGIIGLESGDGALK